MIDVEKQIAFWRTGAEEDLAVSRELTDRGRIRHGLFFLHLALEKALKAHVCRATHDVAPRVHNLVRLLQRTGLRASSDQIDTLAEMNVFNIEGRYPQSLLPVPTATEARNYMVRTEEVFRWLMSLL
jgi:HEPN domain-containing protein